MITAPVLADLGNENLGAASLALRFDPARLQFIDCAPDPNAVFDFALCQRSEGIIRLNLISIEGAEGQIALANIRFRNPGASIDPSYLALEQGIFVDRRGNDIKSQEIHAYLLNQH